MDTKDLLEFDNRHVWHPYASAINAPDNLLVKRCEGVYIELENDKKLVDGMSSWWSAIHGYNVPELNEAIKSQLDDFSHVMFGGLTHEPAVKLAKLLLEIVPEGLEHVFFNDSGSVAVEVAMKMALQYWSVQGKGNKNRFVTIRNGYHGDTWHAMSVCDPDTGMHQLYHDKLPDQLFLPAPQSKLGETFNPNDLTEIEALIASKNEEIAAFILEPIVQGAGGMRFYHPEYLKTVREICTAYDVLLIADEIATGFGRTGKLFACEHANISPDIMCVGKAITGGYMSFAATFCTHEIASVMSSLGPGVFMHGPTFMGNPLASAVATASIKLLLSRNWQSDIERIENHFRKNLLQLEELEAVHEVRVLGAIGVVEMKEPVDMKRIRKELIEEGVWLRPFGKLIYSMPPFVISDMELAQLTTGMVKSIENYVMGSKNQVEA